MGNDVFGRKVEIEETDITFESIYDKNKHTGTLYFGTWKV